MRKFALSLALVAALTTPALAQTATGVIGARVDSDTLVLDVNAPQPANLVFKSGDSIIDAPVPAGHRDVRIPLANLQPLLADQYPDFVMLRTTDNMTVVGTAGVRLTSGRPSGAMRDHSPYLVSLDIKPGDDALLAVHGFIPR